MPFNGPALPEEQIGLIARWIDRLPPKDPALLLREAETRIQVGEKEIASARVALTSIEARIAAENAKYKSPPDPKAEELAVAARVSDQQANLVKCQEDVLKAQLKLSRLLDEPLPSDEAERNARDRNLAAARKDLEAAVTALANPKEGYTPVGKIYPRTSTGRRLALARWIAAKDNPLTARVAVNHMWLRHFGQPLVSSVVVPPDAQSLSIVAEASASIPMQLVAIDPNGVSTIASGTGIVTLNVPVSASGMYTIQAVNLSLGPVTIWTAATPQVSR